MKVFRHKLFIIVCCRPQGRETRDTSEFKMGPRDVLACAWQVLLTWKIVCYKGHDLILNSCLSNSMYYR